MAEEEEVQEVEEEAEEAEEEMEETAGGGGLATEFRADLLNWMPDLDGIAHSEGDDVILKIARDAKIIRKSRKLNKRMLADVVFPEKTTILNGKLYTIYGGGRPKDLDALPFPDWDTLTPDPNNKDILENYINTEQIFLSSFKCTNISYFCFSC